MSCQKHCYISPKDDQIEAFYPCLNKVSNSKKEHPRIGEICLPPDLLSKFYERSLSNTINNIETLGYLYGFIDENENKAFVVYLFVPEQTGTATSCEAVDAEACAKFGQEYGDAVQLGWIHVHPEQACFMSSIDCHVQYHAQRDNKNYIGIVYSHQDREFGIFSISNNGFNVIATCDLNNNNNHNNNNLHHLHNSNDVYVNATHVIYDDELDKTIVIDQRKIIKPQPTPQVAFVVSDEYGQQHAIILQNNNNNSNSNNNAASECNCPNCARRKKMNMNMNMNNKEENNFGQNGNELQTLQQLQLLLQMRQLMMMNMNGASRQCNCPNCVQERKWQENELEIDFEIEDSKESKDNDSDFFTVDQNEENIPQWLTTLKQWEKETQDQQTEMEKKDETENKQDEQKQEAQTQIQHKQQTPEIFCYFSCFKKGLEIQDSVSNLERITMDNCDVVRVNITLLKENEFKVESFDKVFIDCNGCGIGNNLTNVSNTVQKHYEKLFKPFTNKKNGIMSRDGFKRFIICYYNTVDDDENDVDSKIDEIFSVYSQDGNGLTLNEFFNFCTNGKEKTVVSIDLKQDNEDPQRYYGDISTFELINELGNLGDIRITLKGTFFGGSKFYHELFILKGE